MWARNINPKTRNGQISYARSLGQYLLHAPKLERRCKNLYDTTDERGLGLKDTLPIYKDTIEYRADVGDGLIEHEVVDLFVIHVEKKPNLILNPEEVMDILWIDYSDLQTEVSLSPEHFTPWVRIYIKEHANKIFNQGLLNTSVT